MWTPARIGTLALTTLVALAVPAVVAAQVTVDHETSSAATATTQHNFSFICTAGRPYLVLIALNPHVIAGPIVSVVYDPAGSNVSLTSAGTGAEQPDGAHGGYIFTRSDGAGCNGTSKTMRITYTDEASQSNVVAISFNGAHAVTPFTDYTTQLSATTAISITVPNVAANDYAVSMWSVHNPTTVTVGTQIAQTGIGHMGVSLRRAGNGTMAGTQDFDEPVAVAGIRVAASASAPAPVISSLSSASGTVGQSVTISGSNFGATQGSGTVTFNGVVATVSSWSASNIVTTVPAAAGTGPVLVTVNGATSNAASFAINAFVGCSGSPNVVYQQNWHKGVASVAMKSDGGYYQNMRWGGSGAVDPLYPEIAASETVTVITGAGPSGENVLDRNPAKPDYVISGLVVGGFGTISDPTGGPAWWDASQGCLSVSYNFTTAAWDQAYYNPLLTVAKDLYLFNAGLSLDADVSSDRQTAALILGYRTPDGWQTIDTYQLARATTENEWQTFDVRWKAGTVDTSGNVSSDGWVLVFLNGTAIYGAVNVPLRLGTTAGNPSGRPNLMRTIWLGFDGLFGPTTNLILTDGMTGPPLLVFPTQISTSNIEPLREMCLNPQAWPTGWSRMNSFGNSVQYWDAWTSDSEVAQCFANLRAAGKQLVIEAGVLKPQCATAQACWNLIEPTLTRLAGLNPPPLTLALDEPLTWKPQGATIEYVVDQTAQWISLARTQFPDVKIILHEAYPSQSAATLKQLFRDVNNEAIVRTGWGIQYASIDHDWRDPGTNLMDVLLMQEDVRANGMKFAVVFWNSEPTMDWYDGLMHQGEMYQDWRLWFGLSPDLYSVIDWANSPATALGETSVDYKSFANSLRDFSQRFLPVASLRPNTSLYPGQSVNSVDGRFSLRYQSDGNLVLVNVQTSQVLWNSNTTGTTPGITTMQSDGNLVVYNASGIAVWASNTSGHMGAFLVVQGDGNLVIYTDFDNMVLWASNTNCC